MKRIEEMTEQEILNLSEEDVQKMIKLRMAEKGIRIMDRPKQPELFEIEPADVIVYTIPLLGSSLGFTDANDAQKMMEFLINSKSLVKVDYDYNNLGSDYKCVKNAGEKEFYSSIDPISIVSTSAYSKELYAKICDFAIQNKKMKGKVAEDQKHYDEAMESAADIVTEIRGIWIEVKNKYNRLDEYTNRFKLDYLPLADNDEEMAMKFMAKAYSLNDEEEKYILTNYNLEYII